jgi:serine phosphatase RsbU (regulator of sigma subunit)
VTEYFSKYSNSMAARIFTSVGLLVLLVVLFMGSQSLSTLEGLTRSQFEFSTKDEVDTLKLTTEKYFSNLAMNAENSVTFSAKGVPTIALSQSFVENYQISSGRLLKISDGTVVYDKMLGSGCPATDILKTKKWVEKLYKNSVESGGIQAVASQSGDFNKQCFEFALPLTYKNDKKSGKSNALDRFMLILVLGNKQMEDISRTTKSSYVAFYDERGRILSRSGTSRDEGIVHEAKVKDVQKLQKSNAKKSEVQILTSAFGKKLLAVVTRVSTVANVTMVTTLESNAFYATIESSKRDIYTFGIVFLLLALGVTFGLSNALSDPIQHISATTEKISDGDFSVRVKVDGVYEIRTLAGSVNTLTQKIEGLMHQQKHLGRLHAEMETAQLVQETLFPIPNVAIGQKYLAQSYATTASECGGDLWGFIALPNNRFCIYIADASGHGVPSAFTTVAVHSTFSLLESIGSNVATNAPWTVTDILMQADAAVRRVGQGRILMTMFIAIIDENNHTIEYANAGHTKPIFVTSHPSIADQVVCTLLPGSGTPLGFEKSDLAWKTWTKSIKSSDKIVMYTDGFTENTQHLPRKICTKSILRLLEKSAGDHAPTICSKLEGHYKSSLGDVAAADDCTLVVFERLAS